MNYSFKLFLFAGLILGFYCHGQTSLTLEKCQEEARLNYPLISKYDLIAKTKEFSVSNASKGYLPQLSVSIQASYQSEVTQIPISMTVSETGITIPTLDKAQYRIYGEISQVVYDGGIIRQQKKSIETNEKVQMASLDVELYKIKNRVNELFFGCLIIDKQLKQNSLLQTDLQLGINKTIALIANGSAYRSNADVLKAELLNAKQQETELDATRKGYLEMLGQFINQSLNETTKLIIPDWPFLSDEIHRPELAFFAARNSVLDVQKNQISARNLPKFNLFFQGGYGRPALNMMSNDFNTFYIGGLRLYWGIESLYTSWKEKELLSIIQQQIASEKETFLFNTSLETKQQTEALNKYRGLLKSDDAIIVLRNNVKTASAAQLENGVISSSDFLRDVNAEDLARQRKILHEIQLLMTAYQLKNTKGN